MAFVYLSGYQMKFKNVAWYRYPLCVLSFSYKKLHYNRAGHQFFYAPCNRVTSALQKRNHYFRRELTQQQFNDEFKSIFGDEAPLRTSFHRWYGEFNRGCSSLQDEISEGRPKSVVIPETN